ncbi:M13 family metallopeptidase [Parenemella sanctibonifatiensis]|uniref:Peptidase M13 n=1 Tax=Parenemella sanctibonifatiensis TaxID=2016505 RepID=A0A255E7X2_9ACTN|nr:M13-type metalloendopeptidase [Parenemella sanctibonifatiensis]OYN87678.1 peptidase M13 [Parenemella sanctibonifatiensis]
MDPDVRPADDLFRHVNGGWLKTVTIDPDKPMAAAFTDLRDAAEEAVRDIITGLESGAPGSETAKVADLYASFMDEDRVEAAGLAPIADQLAAIAAIDSVDALADHLGWAISHGVGSLLDFGVDSDPGDPQRYVLFADQSGIGLPDEAYYREPQHEATRTAYVDHIEAMFTLAGLDDPRGQAEAVMELETEIASHHWDRVTRRDLKKMYNLQTWTDFTGTGLPLARIAEAAGLSAYPIEDVVNSQPSFFTDVAALVTADRLPAWRSWAAWHLLHAMAPLLSSAFVAENFAFYGKTLMGTEVLRDRWKRGVTLVESYLGEAVGKIYVEHHFKPAAKERMDELVANLVAAYRESISQLDWMTQATRQEALTKLAAFRPKIGYPDKWRDYSALEISADDLVGNAFRAADFELKRQLGKLGGPIDRDEWLMTPQTVNAYYHPLLNEIVFPAAILQPPFFHAEGDDAVNYGGIGAVIGHEIGHGFDDQGSTCDGEGRLRDWWTEEDRTAFEDRTKALIGQYNALSPEGADGQHVNGELTIGENIGDLGGLSIAYTAYKLALDGTEPEPIDGLTGDQRFFYNWAAVWRAKLRPEAVKQRLATDPHSPNEFRCNQILRNVPAFYDAFGVTKDDQLWLDEDDRVKIW